MATLDRLGPPAAASPGERREAWKPGRAIAVALTIAGAIALLQVIVSSTFTDTGQQLHNLEDQRASLQAEIYQTEADVAALASLDRTERIARDRLGMVPAAKKQYVSVDVEAPRGALLPRPIVQLPASDQTSAPNEDEPWWRAVLEALPLP
jgi:hypothetical protein